jgi:hypothetical protein
VRGGEEEVGRPKEVEEARGRGEGARESRIHVLIFFQVLRSLFIPGPEIAEEHLEPLNHWIASRKTIALRFLKKIVSSRKRREEGEGRREEGEGREERGEGERRREGRRLGEERGGREREREGRGEVREGRQSLTCPRYKQDPFRWTAAKPPQSRSTNSSRRES